MNGKFRGKRLRVRSWWRWVERLSLQGTCRASEVLEAIKWIRPNGLIELDSSGTWAAQTGSLGRRTARWAVMGNKTPPLYKWVSRKIPDIEFVQDDDDFGDLYTDVLRPLTATHPTHADRTVDETSPQSRSIDPPINSDDEETLHGAADLKDPCLISNALIQEKTLPKPDRLSEHGGFNLNIGSNSRASKLPGDGGVRLEATTVEIRETGSSGGFNFLEDEDDLDIVVEERDYKHDDMVEKDVNVMDKQKKFRENTSAAQGPGGKTGPDQKIPGLGPNFADEWESDDSEDDLQIVLNDSHHGPLGMEKMQGMDVEDGDEDGDQLVIVADNGEMGHHHQPILDERELGTEEGGPTADGERKESGDATKAGGVQPKIGYSNHLYHHHPFHSQFKKFYSINASGSSCLVELPFFLINNYVRPGAAPLPGGIQGLVRPPVTVGPGAGRGRGEWRPRGPVPMQKGLHPGYGMPGWGPNTAGRGYGSGLDFTLPSHKTIFEVDIDGFEEKPWRLPEIEMSDFFNFGLNEEGWKDYCKQLEQLRLETTMQGKIRVYESGRMEQDYDPDLPPELAAAVGNQEVPSENGNAGAGEASDLARGSAALPSVPVGRSIPVETGSGDRLPSTDTRRPRMHDADAIIEIVCQSSNDDDMAEQQDNDVVGEDIGGVDDIDVVQEDDAGHVDHSSHAYKEGENKEIVARKKQIASRDELGGKGDPREQRYTKGTRQAKSPTKTNPSDDDDGDKQDGKQNPVLSSEDAEPAVAIEDDDTNGDSTMDDEKSLDDDKERENSKFGGIARSKSRCSADHWRKRDRVERDEGLRPRERDDFVKTQHRKADDAHNKRRKDRTYSDRGSVAGKEEKSYSHNRESSRRKRERDDDDARAKSKDDDTYYGRQKEVTGARAPEDKKWIGNSRGKDDYKGSGRDYRSRNVDRLKRRDRVEDNSFSRSRGREDAHARGSRQGSKDEKRTANERLDREVYASDISSRQHEHNRQKVGSRKDMEFESGEHSSLNPSERNHNDGHSGQMSEMFMLFDKLITYFSRISDDANLRAKTEQSNPETNRQLSRNDGEEASSDDEHRTNSKRGRSKFERWTSHQEKDFTTTSISSPSSFKNTNKDSDTPNSTLASLAKNMEYNKSEAFAHDKDANAKPVIDDNRHMDTVEKLKKRSERFKLPMSGGKESVAVKKVERESLPSSAQTEIQLDLEIKPERPARKRRWTGN
ncbi:homolog of yeast FIP1 [Striga asiatica]|uniref:Homolog of yeast FIP1 n=1 Tax=Striga asiatica TaxID=4170 RepID=A0A5A7PSJ7_STRAF|nr:homolog of yeast FIP1 [Striga asiatica]